MSFSPIIRRILMDLARSRLPPVDQRDYNPQGKLTGERGGKFDIIQPGTAHFNINKSKNTLKRSFQTFARKNGVGRGVSEAIDYLSKDQISAEEAAHIAQVAKTVLGKDLGPVVAPKPVTAPKPVVKVPVPKVEVPKPVIVPEPKVETPKPVSHLKQDQGVTDGDEWINQEIEKLGAHLSEEQRGSIAFDAQMLFHILNHDDKKRGEKPDYEHNRELAVQNKMKPYLPEVKKETVQQKIPKQDAYTAEEVKKYSGKDVPEGKYVLSPIHPKILDKDAMPNEYYSSKIGYGKRMITTFPDQVAPVGGDQAFLPEKYVEDIWTESHAHELREYIEKYVAEHDVDYTIRSDGLYALTRIGEKDDLGYTMYNSNLKHFAEKKGDTDWKFDRSFAERNEVATTHPDLKQAAQEAVKLFLNKVNDDTADAEDEYLYALATSQHPSHEDHPIMTYIADRIGFHAPPQVISSEEFDRLNSDPAYVTMRRGVGGDSLPGFIAGENKIQRYGIYGSGCYNMVCQVETVQDPKAVGATSVQDPKYKKISDLLSDDLNTDIYEMIGKEKARTALPYFVNSGKQFLKMLSACKKEGKSFDEAYNILRAEYNKDWKTGYEYEKFIDYFDGVPRSRFGSSTVTFSEFFSEGGSGSDGQSLGWDINDLKARFAGDPKAVKEGRYVHHHESEWERQYYTEKYTTVSDADKYTNFEKNLKDLTNRYESAYEPVKDEKSDIDTLLTSFSSKHNISIPDKTQDLIKDTYKKVHDYEMILKPTNEQYMNRPTYRGLFWSGLPKINVKNGADAAFKCANLYADSAREKGKAGYVMRLAVDPTAKIASYDDVVRAKFDLSSIGVTDPTDQKVLRIMMMRDPGLKALLMGYDGYTVEKSHTDLDEVDYMLMFNRSKMMIVDPRSK